MTLKPPTHLNWDERLPESEKSLVNELNASIDRLDAGRAVEINASGPFLRSKIAWKLAVYQHVLLHRIVALMDGAALAWNNRSTLSAILTARALMETIAVMAHFEDSVREFLGREDLGALDAYVQRGTFASRDPKWIDEFPETKAINVMTFVEKFDKRVPGFKGHYDILSERCHPNSSGHNFMFSKLNHSDASVSFSDEREPGRNGQMILAALGPLPLIESMMTRLTKLLLDVADLHHRKQPIVSD
jgi:hypothetical protein